MAHEFYRKITQAPLYKTDAVTAELAKLVENSFRDVTIAFSNEISMVCEKLDVDCKHLIELCNLHPRVDILRPSIGAQRALSCGLILIFCTIPLPAIHH
jgi:UDP-N-acetyl-D-mannosaminuronic acid dehydrogenase